MALVFDPNRVRNTRIRRGLSRNEVADATGIRHGVLHNIESGMRAEPHMATLRKLAELYGVEVVDFYAEVPVELGRPFAAEGVA